jgi:hypothetical protein
LGILQRQNSATKQRRWCINAVADQGEGKWAVGLENYRVSEYGGTPLHSHYGGWTK